MNTLIDRINELQGVETKALNMFNLHELFIDGVLVAYVRTDGELIHVIVHFNFASPIGANYKVSVEFLNEMIQQYRVKNCFYPVSKRKEVKFI